MLIKYVYELKLRTGRVLQSNIMSLTIMQLFDDQVFSDVGRSRCHARTGAG